MGSACAAFLVMKICSSVGSSLTTLSLGNVGPSMGCSVDTHSSMVLFRGCREMPALLWCSPQVVGESAQAFGAPPPQPSSDLDVCSYSCFFFPFSSSACVVFFALSKIRFLGGATSLAVSCGGSAGIICVWHRQPLSFSQRFPATKALPPKLNTAKY